MIEDRDHRKKLLQFLMGLKERFATARGQILMMVHLPTISQAYYPIKQEEKQRQGVYMVNAPFLGSGKSAGSSNMHNVTEKSHTLTFTKNDGVKKSSLKCNYCHKEGRTKETCYKLVGLST